MKIFFCFLLMLLILFITGMSMGVTPEKLVIDEKQEYEIIISNPNAYALSFSISTSENDAYFMFYPKTASIKPGQFQKVMIEKKEIGESGEKPEYVFIQGFGSKSNLIPSLALKIEYKEDEINDKEDGEGDENEEENQGGSSMLFFLGYFLFLLIAGIIIGILFLRKS